ncbi:MAG: FG-GAP repeat protein [Streptomyces sp.]|uniref:FG-GAP repeat protein n=1 Tax=Streptomyces sp. TaxID=1931 RepID=UPI003D6C6A08
MHKRFRITLATAAAAALTSGLLTASAVSAAAAPSGLKGDFNGDGVRDVVVSAAQATVGGKQGAGQIVVLYGSTAGGVSAAKRTTISQNSAGVPGTAETNDHFGGMTSAGDFDGDGYADVAVGAAHEDVGSDTDGGAVTILWGSAAGLSAGTTVADPAPTKHDRFGRSMAAADYNGDSKDDLAIGSSSATIDVLRGGFTRSGTTGGHYSVTPPIMSGSDTGPIFLTPGDVNGDQIADLVVDGYETDSADGWNANYYVRGSASGLTASGAVKLPAGIITAIGDLNSDTYGDIVIGMAWDDGEIPGASRGGKVNVVNGSASGPGSSASYTISQDTTGVPGSSEAKDQFGGELALGDVNADGHLDLAVGAYGESLNGVQYTGAVTLIYGTADGLTGTGSQFFSQDTPGVPGSNESSDNFGSDVHLADLNGDGKADLTVGVAGENTGNGSVTSLDSDGAKIVTPGATVVSPSNVGVSTDAYPTFGHNFAG